MSFTYPNSQLDEPEALLELLGSFWSALFGDKSFVQSYATAKGQLELQPVNDINEAADAVGRNSCPVLHRVRWHPIPLLQSQKIAGSLLKYGAGAVYGPQLINGVVYAYGLASDMTVGYPVLETLVSADLICERIADPAVALVRKVDFELDQTNGKLIFLLDPFLDPLIPQTPVYDALGKQVDAQITLWVFNAGLDTGYLYRQFGYVLGLPSKSTQADKDTLNYAWDALVSGSSRREVEGILAAYSGSPLAETDGEVVAYVTQDENGLLVITDKKVYRYSASANPIVAVGAVLSAGQALTDVCQVYALNAVTTPSVRAISLGAGYLDPSINGELTFLNSAVPLQVTTAADGHTVVQFLIGGDPADVAQFWALMDQKGLAAGTTLAKLLDTRTVKLGEPVASNLPATVNPVQFLVSNVLRYGLLLAVIRGGAFGPDATGADQDALLRTLMPPQKSLLILVQLEMPADSITMNGSTYYSEQLSTFDMAGTTVAETADITYVSDGPVSVFYV